MCGSDPRLSAPGSSSSGTVRVSLSRAHKGQPLPWLRTCAPQTHQSPTWLPTAVVGVASARVPGGSDAQEGGSEALAPAALSWKRPSREVWVQSYVFSEGLGTTDMGCRLRRALLCTTSEVSAESFAAYLCGADGHPWDEVLGPGRIRSQSSHPGMECRGARRRGDV